LNKRSKLGRPPERRLLLSLNVQFWKTENSWGLDGSRRRGHRRDISCLVDAADVRTVNTYPAWSMSVMEVLRQLSSSLCEIDRGRGARNMTATRAQIRVPNRFPEVSNSDQTSRGRTTY